MCPPAFGKVVDILLLGSLVYPQIMTSASACKCLALFGMDAYQDSALTSFTEDLRNVQARRKSFQQQMLLSRSTSKQPLIGRDRLAILRANGTLPHVNNGAASSLGQSKRSPPAPHVSVEITQDDSRQASTA